jgi:hypothetical protein
VFSFLGLLPLIVARLAQALPVRAIPKQDHIATVGAFVIDNRSRLDNATLLAAHA